MALMASLLLAASAYTGLIKTEAGVVDCAHILNRYAHGGVPSAREDEKVKLCCRSLRIIARQGSADALLIAHLEICRQLGR